MKTHAGTKLALSSVAANLVDHHICAVLLLNTRLLRCLLLTVCALAFVHFHVIVATLFSLLFLIFALGVFNVDLLAAGLRLGILVVGGACSIFSTCHCCILAFYRGSIALLLFVLFLLDAVLVAICVKIGLGLLRRELCWCRLLGIPNIVSCVAEEDDGG